ncbi:QacE family quaternary ammonium compound efflux SMR transporter [Arthrobacter sp. MYb227]|uniref:DMT family transporter n=1 Tax=Arthrobacter sp. MYb227 TaxID=1848601 RepID=UPI000CFC5108|nr:multidrug efflux SMR transporter [Arthrobacter sp. MYb227]PQZ94786.1 QacE family quaternary ammonium compound efflux SMR transporter [Arthrobacter sp. MYb227]
MHWFLLIAAIVAEVIATTLLKVSAGFTKPLPSIGTVLGYAVSFYLLSLVLRYVPLSMAYAIWAAAGTVAIAVVGVVFFAEKLSVVQIAGILLTAVGVAMINLGAGSAAAGSTEISSL